MEKAATPGPWGFDDDVNDHLVTAGRDADGAFIYCDSDADVRFKAAVRNALPGMIRELRELRESDARWSAFAEEVGRDSEILKGQRDDARRELREARELLRSAEHGLASSEDTDEGWLSSAIPLIAAIRAHLAKHAGGNSAAGQPKEKK
jgi:hypothetical protein